jgi:MFS family permease
VWIAATGLLPSALGTYLGGALTDRVARSGVHWYMRVPAIASLLSIPFTCLFYLWPDGRVALLISIPGTLLGLMYLGPTFAMTQSLVRPDMRALAAAILLFIINAIGLGLGPWFVGSLSDALEPSLGVDSIRWAALCTSVVGTSWAALHFLMAGRTLREDLLAKHA